MKRILLLAALCLFATPVKAAMFQVENGSYDVTGDFSAYPPWGMQGYFGYTFNASVNPGTYDAYNGPFYGYGVSVTVNSTMADGCSYSQVMSMCGRGLHNPGTGGAFYVNDPDGDGVAWLNVSAYAFVQNMTIEYFDVWVNLPDGFTLAPHVAAVPEPSTWIMMLIGFAGLVVVSNKGQPLRRVWRLVQRLQYGPDITPQRTISAH
jgi:hypothetical protein